jgi:hypothetical protein
MEPPSRALTYPLVKNFASEKFLARSHGVQGKYLSYEVRATTE